MLQFYFLSVVTNVLGGFALASDTIGERFTGLSSLGELFEKNSTRMILGIITIILGIFKLLSVTKGDIPVVGDLIPALSGIAIGITLTVESYKQRSDVTNPAVERIDNVFVRNKLLIGIIGIVVGILHFLFPTVLFL